MIRNMYVFHTFAIVYYFLQLLIRFRHFFFKTEMVINISLCLLWYHVSLHGIIIAPDTF